MSLVVALDPASKVARAFDDIAGLTQAIQVYKYIPIRVDGTPMVVNYLQAEGGYILDGVPMNVLFDGVWLEGQKEVGAKYWGQPGVPYPSQEMLNLPVVPMPAQVQQQYQAYKAAQSALGGLPSWVLYAGAAVLLMMLIPKKGKGSSSGFGI